MTEDGCRIPDGAQAHPTSGIPHSAFRIPHSAFRVRNIRHSAFPRRRVVAAAYPPCGKPLSSPPPRLPCGSGAATSRAFRRRSAFRIRNSPHFPFVLWRTQPSHFRLKDLSVRQLPAETLRPVRPRTFPFGKFPLCRGPPLVAFGFRVNRRPPRAGRGSGRCRPRSLGTSHRPRLAARSAHSARPLLRSGLGA